MKAYHIKNNWFQSSFFQKLIKFCFLSSISSKFPLLSNLSKFSVLAFIFSTLFARQAEKQKSKLQIWALQVLSRLCSAHNTNALQHLSLMWIKMWDEDRKGWVLCKCADEGREILLQVQTVQWITHLKGIQE